MNLTTSAIGKLSELKALRFLKSKDLKLVTQNYTSKFGEIDLIMLDKDILVFIEVRYRKSKKMGLAAESVNLTKQKKIIITAEYFLQNNPKYIKHYSRFDIVSFDGLLDGLKAELNWIQSAFET